MLTTFVAAPPPALNLSPLRHGPYDPTFKLHGNIVWRAFSTSLGDVTVRYAPVSEGVEVHAWGDGAEVAIEGAPASLGVLDRRKDYDPSINSIVAQLDRRFGGLRFISTRAVFDAALPFCIEQRVTSQQAHQSWRALVRKWGRPAPGPADLMIAPSAKELADQPYWAFHPLGIERQRAETIRRLAARSVRVEEAITLPKADRRTRLEAFDGIGPWTSAHVANVAWGDPDAVPLGDFHFPKIVVHALTGRRGGDDDAMMELLQPFLGHRARVLRLLLLSGLGPAARVPRMKVPDIRAI